MYVDTNDELQIGIYQITATLTYGDWPGATASAILEIEIHDRDPIVDYSGLEVDHQLCPSTPLTLDLCDLARRFKYTVPVLDSSKSVCIAIINANDGGLYSRELLISATMTPSSHDFSYYYDHNEFSNASKGTSSSSTFGQRCK